MKLKLKKLQEEEKYKKQLIREKVEQDYLNGYPQDRYFYVKAQNKHNSQSFQRTEEFNDQMKIKKPRFVR